MKQYSNYSTVSSQQPMFPQWTNNIYPQFLPNICQKSSPTTFTGSSTSSSSVINSASVYSESLEGKLCVNPQLQI